MPKLVDALCGCPRPRIACGFPYLPLRIACRIRTEPCTGNGKLLWPHRPCGMKMQMASRAGLASLATEGEHVRCRCGRALRFRGGK
eukprot:1891928-Prymnesium_polylepis.1